MNQLESNWFANRPSIMSMVQEPPVEGLYLLVDHTTGERELFSRAADLSAALMGIDVLDVEAFCGETPIFLGRGYSDLEHTWAALKVRYSLEMGRCPTV